MCDDFCHPRATYSSLGTLTLIRLRAETKSRVRVFKAPSYVAPQGRPLSGLLHLLDAFSIHAINCPRTSSYDIVGAFRMYTDGEMAAKDILFTHLPEPGLCQEYELSI